jgi:hypothetical protein
MKTMTEKQTAILCATSVLVIALITIPLELHPQGGGSTKKAMVMLVFAGVVALGMVLGSRYLITRKRAQMEIVGDTQYRQLADEYRRLADLAITAQEHTDLKLADLSVQMEFLRSQNEALQSILKEVE